MTDLWCVAGEHCRGFAAGEPEQATRTPLCDTCLHAAGYDIRALPADHRDLEPLLAPPLGQWGDGQPRGSGDPPAPIQLHIDELRTAIWSTLVTWEQVVREHAGLSDAPVHGVRASVAATRAVTVIAPRLELLARIGPVLVVDYPARLLDPDHTTMFRGGTYAAVTGAAGILDLVALHRQAVAALGLTEPVRLLPGHCRRCGRPDLRQEQPRSAGDERDVYCGSCGLRCSHEDYRRANGLVAAV
ncbi:MAG: hypothetical protein ACM30G_20075 [Micromonosporaceae bacterium]